MFIVSNTSIGCFRMTFKFSIAIELRSILIDEEEDCLFKMLQNADVNSVNTHRS